MAGEVPSPHPGETELERSQRNFAELLQELRVTQTGVQILFAFLLTIPFSARFTEVGGFETITYLVALMAAAFSAALIIAPVAYHRILFRRGHKPHLVHSAHRLASAGLGFLLVAMVSSVLLVTDFILARSAAIALSAAAAAWFALLWGVLPGARRLRSDGAAPGGGGGSALAPDDQRG